VVALIVVLGVVVLLLAVLVAGLLRSHADILKALHDLGAGVGDPAGDTLAATPADRAQVPLTMGPTLAADRDSTSAPTLAGVTPDGGALAVAPATAGGLTLLSFLSTGCASCAGFWESFRRPEQLGLPAGTRLVVVTKGPDREIPGEVAALAAPGLSVLMSSDAWTDYEVPGSPFFVLVDGTAGRRVGEGVANHISQVAELVRRAEVDAAAFALDTRPGRDVGLDGPARESANDQELLDAGIRPGDPSLYPKSLEDLYGPPDARMPAAPGRVHRAG
jgi:hypothetical protein